MKKTLDINDIINSDFLAREISNQWTTMSTNRADWLKEKVELRNYLYATDTSTTSNNKNPWSNSTTRPKLTQIKDNLHANYFSTLFPQEDWLKWEGSTKDSADEQVKEAITAYVKTKLAQSDFETTSSKLLDDFITYGNCFSTIEFDRGYVTLDGTDEDIVTYVGPRVVRISPHDIVFDPTATDFKSTNKIVRSIVSLGQIASIVRDNPDKEEYSQILDKMKSCRALVSDPSDSWKGDGYCADGFSDIRQYYQSGSVEVLTFYGSIYDVESGEIHSDRVITVIDRAYVLTNEGQPSWLGHDGIYHAGWRERVDNLYAMGPLDNLVGMQYRIDHLENLKADVFDQIAAPKWKIRGEVDDWEDKPHERIYVGDEGDVTALSPDPTALNADFQISSLESSMEEMAGAPKEALGIRSAGEKTAFEVQQLGNASSRIFQHKTAHYERVFVEPMMNGFLETGRRNMDTSETVIDTNSTGTLYSAVSKKDLVGEGRLRPVGARHFAERALRLANLNQLWQIKQGDPSVGAHLSGKKMAQILANELGEGELFGDNITVAEQLETQSASQEAQVMGEEEQILMEENEL